MTANERRAGTVQQCLFVCFKEICLYHSSLGFVGQFLDTIKSIYHDDCVQCEVNGLTTWPVFLRRGLRQGFSLSPMQPMLFNLYVSGVGNFLTLADDGFGVGTCLVSALFFV